jgi:hypothetical protein
MFLFILILIYTYLGGNSLSECVLYYPLHAETTRGHWRLQAKMDKGRVETASQNALYRPTVRLSVPPS